MGVESQNVKGEKRKKEKREEKGRKEKGKRIRVEERRDGVNSSGKKKETPTLET